MSENSNNSPWKNKFHSLINTAGEELKRTTAIGIKMVSASQTNSELHEKYEELGKLAAEALEAGSLSWENEKAKSLVEAIEKLQETLEAYEQDVQHIKNNT